MGSRIIWTVAIALGLLSGGWLFANHPGEAWAAEAPKHSGAAIKDRGVKDSHQRVTPAGTSTRRVLASPRNLTFPITVSTWLNGSTMRRDAMLALSFHVTEELSADPRFQVVLLRGRSRTVKATLPAPSRIGTGRTFESQWRIPADFETGSDFFFRVTHTPTNKKGFGGLFTIR